LKPLTPSPVKYGAGRAARSLANTDRERGRREKIQAGRRLVRSLLTVRDIGLHASSSSSYA